MTAQNDAYRAQYDLLWQQTVDTLTDAVRLDHPERGAVDFADFLTTALRATAANVGSIDRLTAGRSGSWESAKLKELLTEASGDDPTDLIQWRTEPVVVPLNVAELVEDEYDATPLDERGNCPEPHHLAILEAGDDDTEAEAITARYTAGYRLYAEKFSVAVLAASWDIPGLEGAVSTRVDARPDQTDAVAENPDEFTSDPLIWKLWSAARHAIGRPAVLGGNQD